MRKLNVYESLIAEACGLSEADLPLIQEIEETMRLENPTLNHLSRPRLISEARLSHEVVKMLAAEQQP